MPIDIKDKIITLECLREAYDSEEAVREYNDSVLHTRIDNLNITTVNPISNLEIYAIVRED